MEHHILTTSQAAAELGITRETLSQQIAAGRLRATRFGRLLVIKRTDVEA